MTDYPAAIPLFAIQQLRCPKMPRAHEACAHLAGAYRIEFRTFDCSECDHADQIAIPLDDRAKSDAVGRFTGELHPRR